MGYGWEGELVRLVPIDKAKHLDNAIRWVNDPEISRYLLIGDFPMTRIAEEAWFDRMSAANDKDVVMAIETLDGEHVGMSGIHAINWRDGSATTGTIIGAREHWGKGLGSDAARLRSSYAFDVLGLRYLISAVLEGNERSLRMLRKSGYVECGCYPKRIWKRGSFHDETVLYMTREMWLAGRES